MPSLSFARRVCSLDLYREQLSLLLEYKVDLLARAESPVIQVACR
jgi:hypothetical protein